MVSATTPAHISPRLFLASFFEYLSDPDGAGIYWPRGNTEPVGFDVTEEFPASPADFSANRGRVVLAGPNNARIDSLGAIASYDFRVTAFAHSRNDAAYLGEHLGKSIASLSRQNLPPMAGQRFQMASILSFAGPLIERSSELHYSSVAFRVWLSIRQAQKK